MLLFKKIFFCKTHIFISIRFWVPGPDASFIADLKYLRGFTQLQDLIDRAFLRLQGENEMITQTRKKREIDSNSITNNIDDIGVYTQEFPYPCFIRDKYVLLFLNLNRQY